VPPLGFFRWPKWTGIRSSAPPLPVLNPEAC
jgi:hypothetical protein